MKSISPASTGKRESRTSSLVYVLLCAIPALGTVLFGGVDRITWALFMLLMTVIVGLWLFEAWQTQRLRIDLSSLQIPFLGLIVIGLIQLLPLGASVQPELAFPATHTLSLDPYATRFFIRNLIILLAFLTLCRTFFTTEKRLRRAAIFVIIFGAVMAFIGVLQRIANVDGIYGLRFPFQAISFGPFVNQHHFAAFMEMTGGMTLGLLFGSSVPRERKFLLGFALIVMIAALVLTSSRGGMLSFLSVTLLAGLVSFLARPKQRSRGPADERPRLGNALPVAGAIFAITVTVFGLVLFLGGDESLTRGLGIAAQTGGAGTQGDLTNGRLHFWSVALKIFFDHPIIGAGFEAFGVAFTKYDTWNGIFRVEQAHNDYLQMLADGGILALTAVLAFIVLVFKRSLKVIRDTASSLIRREIAIGALAGCFGIMIHSFFDFPLRTWSNSFFLMLLVTFATVYVSSHNGAGASKRRRSSER